MAYNSQTKFIPAGESVNIDFSILWYFLITFPNVQDSSFDEAYGFTDDLNSSNDSSHGLRIKIVPDVGSRAGIDNKDFDTKLDDNIKIWFDGFKDNFKLCK